MEKSTALISPWIPFTCTVWVPDSGPCTAQAFLPQHLQNVNTCFTAQQELISSTGSKRIPTPCRNGVFIPKIRRWYSKAIMTSHRKLTPCLNIRRQWALQVNQEHSRTTLDVCWSTEAIWILLDIAELLKVCCQTICRASSTACKNCSNLICFPPVSQV